MSETHRSIKERLAPYAKQTAKLLGCVALAGAVNFPFPTEKAIEHSEIDTNIFDFRATIGLRPGDSKLDLLNVTNIFTPASVKGIGVDAHITGLPHLESIDDLKQFFSPERLSLYSSLSDSPEEAIGPYKDKLVNEIIDTALLYNIPDLVIGLGLYGGLTIVQLIRRVKELEDQKHSELSIKKMLALGSATVFLLNSGAAYWQFDQWRDDAAVSRKLLPIRALEGTSLEGTAVDNPGVVELLENGVTYAKLQKERRTEQREAYVEKVKAQLSEQIGRLEAPKENEKFVLTISDMHASRAGIEILSHFIAEYRKRFGPTSLTLVLNMGDISQGLDVQKSAILDLGDIIPEGEQVLSPGNHDLKNSLDYAREAGITVLDGYAGFDGMTIYGRPDPEQTPFLQSSYFPDPNFTEQELGDLVYRDITEKRADFVDIHEPAALAEMLGMSVTELMSFLAEPTDLTSPCEEDGIPDISAGVITVGHTHDQFPLHRICNSDGTWTDISLIGSVGGANEASVVNNWSDQDGKPVKTLAFRGIYLNQETRSGTGALDISIDTDGNVTPITRTDIGTVDGTPYPVTQVSRSKDRVN